MKKGVGWVVTVGGGLTTLVAIVNDILVPNGYLLSAIVMVLTLLGLGATFLSAGPAARLCEPCAILRLMSCG